MSKSYNNTIPIFADEGSLKKTIMKIKTNSLEPGVPKDITDCNIFAIFKSIANENEVKSFQQMSHFLAQVLLELGQSFRCCQTAHL